MIKNLQHGNLPGEVSNNKYICSSKKQDYYSLHVHPHSVCSIFQRMLCLYLFSFLFVALSSLLRTSSSLCRCLSLFSLNFGMACQKIDLMYICQFINDRFIRNFNKFQSDETLKTRWGQSDSLDCHMGVTWFDAARWLAASRRFIIFLLKYYDLS